MEAEGGDGPMTVAVDVAARDQLKEAQEKLETMGPGARQKDQDEIASHLKTIEPLTTVIRTHDQQLADIKAKHQQAIENLRKDLTAKHDQRESLLKAKHMQERRKDQAEQLRDHREEVQELNGANQRQMNDITKKFADLSNRKEKENKKADTIEKLQQENKTLKAKY